MTDFYAHDNERWIPGFEVDRRVVLAKMGPYQTIFERPNNFKKRFYHSVFNLPIEEWTLPVTPPKLGSFCSISVSVSISFQATVSFAREHSDQLETINDYIKRHYENLLKDSIDQELRSLESAEWLDIGTGGLEGSIEDLIHELLAIRNIQSRSRCTITSELFDFRKTGLEEELLSADPARKAIAFRILRKQRESKEQIARERHENELLEHELKLEHQERSLTLLKQETQLIRQRQEEQMEQVRGALKAEEDRELERIESIVRIKNKQLEHEIELKDSELQSKLEEKKKHASAYDEVQIHLEKEIGLLAMEKQRLNLEDEINKTKRARSRGWVFGGLTGSKDDVSST